MKNYTTTRMTVIAPRITEKGTVTMASANAYVFDVTKDATARSVAREIEASYGVKPVKVNLAPVVGKTMFARGKAGVSGGGKKAYVYLKKGDSIAII
jgi:large subunit ribosomal protein L23